MNFFKNKKGQNAETLFSIITFLVIFGFMSIFGYFLMTQYILGFTAAGFYDGILEDTGNKFLFGIGLIDNTMVLVMIILIIGVGFTNFKLAATPVGFVVTFLMSGLYGLISYFFNFIFAELVSNTLFTATLLVFPVTILICTNLHWIMLVNIVVASITLYAKKPTGQFIE